MLLLLQDVPHVNDLSTVFMNFLLEMICTLHNLRYSGYIGIDPM